MSAGKGSPASNELLAALPRIGAELRLSALLGFGRTIDGELGKILSAISAGDSASRLFRQNERTKPKHTDREAIALVYWFTRACGGKISDDGPAIARVRRAAQLNAPHGIPSIRKIAQRFRSITLDTLEAYARQGSWPLQLIIYSLTVPPGVDDAKIATDEQATAQVNKAVKPLTVGDVARLREYLRKKSPRPTV